MIDIMATMVAPMAVVVVWITATGISPAESQRKGWA